MKSHHYFYLSAAIILLDQITKYLCVAFIDFNTRGIEVLPFFNLVHVYNYGAAFSMFADMGGVQRYVLSFIAILIASLFATLLLRSSQDQVWQRVSYALFIGGALGNLIDRVLHGYVIDFLLFYLQDENGYITWAYPAFNVADIAVCCGAGLLIICSFAIKDSRP